MVSILIVEDDALLQDALAGQLQQLGYAVFTAGSVSAAQTVVQTHGVDGMIVDLGLPGCDGLSLLPWVRQQIPGLPVLVLTARDGIDDRVQGLNAGADDYMTKPFSCVELQARLQAMLRRARLPAFSHAHDSVAVQWTALGPLRIDPQNCRATLAEEELELTQREWELLALLVGRCGEVVTREDVLTAWRTVPGDALQAVPLNSNALEVYVHRLRKKLETSPLRIRNIRGLGYLLEKPNG